MGFGATEKILWVDLSTKEIREEALDEKIYRDYLGGYGLGARILFDRQKPGVDPLGPDNILGFVTGLLTGTDALGGSALRGGRQIAAHRRLGRCQLRRQLRALPEIRRLRRRVLHRHLRQTGVSLHR